MLILHRRALPLQPASQMVLLVRPSIPLLQAIAPIASALAVPSSRLLTSRSTGAPLVTLDYESAGDTESFLGMPLAKPP